MQSGMKIRQNKTVYGLIIAVCLTVFFALNVYAADYIISDCCWEETDGKIIATWEKAESKTQYKVRLYKDGRKVGDTCTVSSYQKDYTDQFLKKGPGKYYFEVYPAKVGKELLICSEELEVDAEYYLYLKHLANEAERERKTTLASDGITIQNCTLYLLEKPGEDDSIRRIELTRGSYSSVRIVEMSDAFENWQPDKKVVITAEVYPDEGYIFSDNVQISCSNATVSGQPLKLEGNGIMVTLEYYPLLKLKKPENVYIDENDKLKWDGSSHTGRYRIRFYCNGEITDVKYAKSRSIDVAAQLGDGCDEIRITALAPSGSRRTRPSDSTILTEVDNYCPKGWQYRSGYWYYFIDGEKCDPGWFEDEDRHKYYFDSKSRMKTGNVHEDGKVYFFNDGTYGEIPVGALVEKNLDN